MIKLDLHPNPRQLSQFGAIALVGFPAMGATLTRLTTGDWGATNLLWGLSLLGLGTFSLSRINPLWIRPIYVGLMALAAPIGFVVSLTLVSAIFFLMVTPVGLIFRLMGKDSMNKSPDPSANSYWHHRPSAPTPASYLKQY